VFFVTSGSLPVRPLIRFLPRIPHREGAKDIMQVRMILGVAGSRLRTAETRPWRVGHLSDRCAVGCRRPGEV